MQPTAEKADYPPEWYDGHIQARIRERANYTCEICGRRFDPVTNAALDTDADEEMPIFGHVHHLDHHPPNCADANLIFLCQMCHIRLHGLGWKPGDELPMSWSNEPPGWILERGLPYKLNPAVRSWHDAAQRRTTQQERARFVAQLIEEQGWTKGDYDPLAAMRAFLRAVAAEYEGMLDERRRLAEQPVLEQAQAWAAARGFVPYDEALRVAGLSPMDFEMAMECQYIQPETCPYPDPVVPLYFDPAKVVLPAVVIQTLWTKIRLTREQAAALLGMPVSFFERKRRQAGLRPFGSTKTSTGRYEPLYRKSDVEKLRG